MLFEWVYSSQCIMLLHDDVLVTHTMDNHSWILGMIDLIVPDVRIYQGISKMQVIVTQTLLLIRS